MGLRARLVSWRGGLDRRGAAWVRRRQGEDALPLQLQRRRLYILPTRAGLGFALLLLTMLFAGLNYANSLALMLSFALGSFTIVGMNHCHRNLLGLRIAALLPQPAFAGETAQLSIGLDNHGVARYDVGFEVLGASATADCVDQQSRRHLDLSIPTQRRGRLRVPRVRVSSRFPFGLFRCWTWLHLPLEILVYPAPVGARVPPALASGRETGLAARRDVGRDELQDLRPFRDGDSPRQVAWKAYARGMPLLVKRYSGAAAETTLFDFDALPGMEVEARLSQLCRWVLDANACGSRYALHLPGRRLAADSGPAHLAHCLEALALYGEDGPMAGASARGPLPVSAPAPAPAGGQFD